MIHAVIGGGNIGTLMAAELVAKGHEVRVVARDARSWSGMLEVLDAEGSRLMEGQLAFATADLERSVDGADVIWVTYPSFMFERLSAELTPLLRAGQMVGVVPGADAEFFFGELRDKGCTLFGLQRVHSIARLAERGKSVYMLGRKPHLEVAAVPSAAAQDVRAMVEELFDIPTSALACYLVETLTPSNPILHTTRLATMFVDWEPGRSYPANIRFYEEWTDASSELLLACDAELQGLCRALERELGVDLSQVEPLASYYESPTVPAMTAKISGIAAFKGLTSPMKEEAPGAWVPDFSSRYFTADFAYGLKAIADLAVLVGADVPRMRDVLSWYTGVSPENRLPWALSCTREELAELYC